MFDMVKEIRSFGMSECDTKRVMTLGYLGTSLFLSAGAKIAQFLWRLLQFLGRTDYMRVAAVEERSHREVSSASWIGNKLLGFMHNTRI